MKRKRVGGVWGVSLSGCSRTLCGEKASGKVKVVRGHEKRIQGKGAIWGVGFSKRLVPGN